MTQKSMRGSFLCDLPLMINETLARLIASVLFLVSQSYHPSVFCSLTLILVPLSLSA